jgi:RND superfamily putative drug exporter
MFERIGHFSSKYRYPIIAAWLVLVVAITLLAPNLSDVITSNQSDFLPKDEPSIVAGRIAAEYFPNQASGAQAVMVIQSETASMHDEAMQAYLADLTHWIETGLAEVTGELLSPAEPALADRLISEDGRVAMIFVGLHGSIEDQPTLEAIDAMQVRLDQAPKGLQGYVTGSVAIADDYKSSAIESADRTTIITIALVVTILLIIYRSPVSPLIPIGTIGIAYLVSRGLVAWLATLGWTVSSITDIFMIVLLFGAGTDYCLFLVSRFREIIADGASGPEGARRTIERVGETISSSAGTVIVGMLAMSFADMKLFASTGPSLALAVVITLLSGLTLTPALLATLGRWAFWPGGARHAKEGRFWGRLARWVTARPWVPLILALVILVPLAIYGSGQGRSFDMLSDLPEEVPSKAGFLLLSENFGAGEMQPLDVIVTEIPDTRSPAGIAHIHTLCQGLQAADGIADVRCLTQPAGKDAPELGDALRVESQLKLMVNLMVGLGAQSTDTTALASLDIGEVAAGLATLKSYLEGLASAFPEIAADVDYLAAQEALGNLEDALGLGQQALLVSDQLAEAASGIGTARTLLDRFGEADPSQMGETVGQLSLLRDYLNGLVEAHPAVAEMEGYAEALAALDHLEATLDQMDELMLVSGQLSIIAQQMDAMAQALGSNPLALMPKEGEPAPAEQMAALQAYMEELGTTYPDLAVTQDYQTATALLEEIATALATMDIAKGQELIAQFKEVLPQLSGAFAGLATIAAETMPQATFIPETTLPSGTFGDPVALIDASLGDLETALQQLGATVAAEIPEATYVPQDLAPEEIEAAAAAMFGEADTLLAALGGLADSFAGQDTFFVPLELAEGEEAAELTRLLDTYTSADGEAARIQVVLADDPFSSQAMDTVAQLRQEFHFASRTYISGGTANYLDMQIVMERDTWRVMGLVVGGIFVVLVLLLRSLIAPIYMIATILLSYGATLGITRVVFDGIMHEELTWFVPFLILVVLVALGMDYNIFLMGRVKEEVAGNGTRAGIERAVQRTGGIITSAGIIMAGTFAAMMSSSLLGLVQLAFAITVGMLLDTFVIRTTLVPALATLLDKWNWWPGKGPGGA